MDNPNPAILNWTCPTCGKVLSSIYPNQIKWFITAHKASHEIQDSKEQLP